MNPTPGKYFSIFYTGSFLESISISPLKEDKDAFCFISAGTIYQIFGPKHENSFQAFPCGICRWLMKLRTTC